MSSLPKTLDDALIHVVKHATDKNMQDSLKLIKELILYNQLFPSECKEHEWWTELTKYQDLRVHQTGFRGGRRYQESLI